MHSASRESARFGSFPFRLLHFVKLQRVWIISSFLYQIRDILMIRRTAGCSFRRLFYVSHKQYARQSVIDDICKGYGEGWKDKIKMYSRMFVYIAKEGFMGAKKDASLFMQLRKKPEQERTEQDWNNLIRMRHDFYRLGPLWIIQILPMSGPLFVAYMYTYPGSIPSWFIIDKSHQDHELEIRKAQKQAVQYFKNKSIEPSQIDFNSMSLEQTRMLANCLYGYYRDGTIGYNRVFNQPIKHFISEGFSKYLIKRKFNYKFNADLKHRSILRQKTFDEKIKWKYQQVVILGELMPKYEDILSPEELKARQDYSNSMKEEVKKQ